MILMDILALQERLCFIWWALRVLNISTEYIYWFQDVHERFRTESHSEAAGRFNERFLLSLASCKASVVMDDELNILPISSHIRSIAPVPVREVTFWSWSLLEGNLNSLIHRCFALMHGFKRQNKAAFNGKWERKCLNLWGCGAPSWCESLKC